ncbi:uncharacterized protein At2g34160-like [Diospyros lotus]|uniref:uncharacterized protein At2g34160-like n=1 Tax=Diospyros lotus TaxID=55363 RepID=UPI0022590FDC|nr:uncharacterized protein At2g34160-like [Diospyros lotus]
MEAMALADTTPRTVAAVEGAKINKTYGRIETQKKNRIQVSNTKKPLFFYLNLAKRCIKQHNDLLLSGLGMAIPTVITIAEILKTNGLAVDKKILLSTVGTKDDAKGRMIQKPKIEILLEKKENVENRKAIEDPEMEPTCAEEEGQIHSKESDPNPTQSS